MTKKSIKLYDALNRVLAGESVSWKVIVNGVAKLGVSPSMLGTIIAPTEQIVDFQPVKVISENSLQELITRSKPAAKVTDRKSAAEAGDSHRHRVSSSYVLIHHGKMEHPEVVICSAHGASLPEGLLLQDTALVIENLENFMRPQETLRFVTDVCNALVESADVIFGSGNTITSAWNKSLFDQYKTIYCLLDLDPGACRIFLNLYNLLDKSSKLVLLISNDAENRLIRSLERGVGALTERDQETIDQLAGKHHQLDDLMGLLRKYQTMLEQEDYLE